MKLSLGLLVALLWAAPALAFDQRHLTEEVCGSAQQYEQEKIWENLPGCVNVAATKCESEDIYSCITYGGRAITWNDDVSGFKGLFMRFYNAWDSGDYEEADSAVSLIRSTMNDLVRDAEAGRVRPSKALFAAWPLLDDHLKQVHRLVLMYDSVKDTMHQINQSYMRIESSLEDAGDKVAQILASSEGKELQRLLDRAQKQEIPEGWVVSGTLGQQPMSLADLRKKLGGWQSTADQRLAATEAAYKAKWAAYDSVVKGDRVRFLEHFKKGTIVFGRGGVRLTTPEQLKTATAMFICLGSPPNQITPTWEVRGAYFQGDKQTAPYSETGVGTTCPTRAFK
jgi:hypothetical protein